MASLFVTLFGTAQAALDGRPVNLPTDKCLALLAYLAVESGQKHLRESLAALLWPEHAEEAARTNLRQTLHRLRLAIGDIGHPHPCLLVTRRVIRLNPDGRIAYDVAEFERCRETFHNHCANGLPLCAVCKEALKTGSALYSGDFMAGFSLSAAPAFELWLLAKREQYRRQALEILGHLGGFYEAAGDFTSAASYARRLVEMEPWRESSHRLLMRSLVQAGQQRAALEQYERCRQTLAEDLGIEPSAKTCRLVAHIRDRRPVGAGDGDRSEAESIPFTGHAYLPDQAGAYSPIVGRREELANLDALLAQALAGQGRVLFIKGEAGSGKTSLAAAFCRRAMAAHEKLLVAYGRCDGQLGLGDPYQPFREALRLLSGQAGKDLTWPEAGPSFSDRLRAVRPAIARLLQDTGPDLPGTLLPAAKDNGQEPGRPEQAALFEQVTRFLRAVARGQPLILVLDDLHWIDTASASLLFHLGRHLAGSRLLIIGAFRPEAVNWLEQDTSETSRHPLLPVINELQRIHGALPIDLDQADGRAFIAAYVDSEPNRLDERFRDSLFERSGGNPLSAVELLRGLKSREELAQDEQGFWVVNKKLNWDLLPARVEALISERMQRLTPGCQSILAVASAQGQTFLAEVAAGVAGNEAGTVIRLLSETLTHEHNIIEAGSREQLDGHMVSRYRFRHHLFQQFAYQQLDDVARSHIHEATGLALEALYAEESAEHAAELARHFEAAGAVDKAVEYLLAAGKSAYRLSANESALSCFDRALNLLEGSPPGPERDRTEMSLHLARTAPVLALRGYTSSEIREAANRVIILAEQLQETDYLFPARLLLLLHDAMLAKYRPARKLGKQLLSQAEREQNPLHLTQAHHMLGYLQFCSGSFKTALNYFDAAFRYTDPAVESLLLSGFIGRNMGLTSLFRRAWALWFLGYPDQSLAALEKTMNRVEKLGQDHDLAFTLAMGICPLLYLRRDFDQAEIQAKRLLRLAAKKNLHYFIPFAQLILGAAMAKRGRTAEGQAKVKSAVAQYRESDEKTMFSLLLSLLVDALEADEEAGKVLDEALELVEESGERFLEAELWRQRGEWLAQRGADPGKVEECFRQALDIAHRQQAKSLELRAATSLARLWLRQGREQEAHTLLVGVLGWFTEGFETVDLQEAQTLLAEYGDGSRNFYLDQCSVPASGP